jgi:uncharacterized protein (DUF427 family)
MIDNTKKIPGSDHPITIEPNPNIVRVTFNGQVVADMMRALTLRESTYKPVFYIPREDVRMALLQRTDHASHCPYKGDASYYTLRVGERISGNAAWSYEHPYEAVGAIVGRIAFYPHRIDTIEEVPRG